MRLTCLRFTVRRLMLAVAVVAVVVFGYKETVRCVRRAAEYRGKATYHTRNAVSYREQFALAGEAKANANRAAADREQEIAKAKNNAREFANSGGSEFYIKFAAYNEEWRDYWAKLAVNWDGIGTKCQRLADYHAELARIYKRAAGHPWWSVPPDPPEPRDPLSDGDYLKEPPWPTMRFDF
jgi:hypothetical protein